MESNTFLFSNETVWENTGEGIKRQILAYNESLMIVKVLFQAGAVGTAHTHPHTQATYVESGVFEFTTEGHTEVVRSGDSIYIKPNSEHGCRCLEKGVLIDTFSPYRRDFLR